MDYQVGFVFGWVDVLDFFDVDIVVLGIGFVVQVVFFDQLFVDVFVVVFGEQGVFGLQFYVGGVVVFFWVVFVVDVEVVGDDVVDYVVFVDQCFLGGEVWIDFYVQFFGLLGQLVVEVVQGDDIVVFVVYGFGYEEVGYFGSVFGVFQDVDVVVGYWGIEWCVEFFLVGEQFVQCVWFEYCVGEDVGVYFGIFFDYVDVDFLIGFGGFLFQLVCGGQIGGVGVDDDDVEFYVFVFYY